MVTKEDCLAWTCQCTEHRFGCVRRVWLTPQEAEEIVDDGLILVVDGHTPEDGDVFVKKGDGYTLHKHVAK